MKGAEEILGQSFYPHECGGMIECVTKQDAIRAINEARADALREAAEEAGKIISTNVWVHKDSILDLIPKLK
jgi:hypothetical protein